LAKLGGEFGMRPSRKTIYGVVEGFPVAMWDGMGTKAISVAINLGECADAKELLSKPARHYRIQRVLTGQDSVRFVFHDTYGTLKRMRAFLQTELPALAARGMNRGYTCLHCGEPVNEGAAHVLVNDFFSAMHADCVEPFEREAEQEREIKRHEPAPVGGSVRGFFGALIGGFVGTIPWVVLFVAGYIASLAGALIALCANFGHKKFGGPPGRGRVLTVVLVTVVMVVVASALGHVASMAWYVISGDLDREMGYLPGTILLWPFLGEYIKFAAADPEFRAEFLKNLAMGFLFAGLGLFGVLRGKMREENPSGKVILKRLDA
jgi:hypothetical protein